MTAATSPSTSPVVRRLPYPYRAQLALCSDLDLTPDADTYFEGLRFLNTRTPGPMGDGVGLEVGNSIYFDMPPDQFSYWGTNDRGREMVRTLIRSGHVDCLHSFGDFANTRAHAERALNELVRHDCHLAVWIDHAVAPSNFGADRMQGSGDVVGSPVYHADLTCAYGITYVWRGRVTSVTGQDVPRRLGGIFSAAHPTASIETLGKEWVKGLTARTADAKYAMHAANAVMRPIRLRSGHAVYEFLRANPHWGGVSSCETADGLSDVLTADFLDRLVGRGGLCVLYTHLGKTSDRSRAFPPAACRALRLLASYVEAGKVMVTTTKRLLDYTRLVDCARVTTSDAEGMTTINVALDGVSATTSADGLTVYVDVPRACRVVLNGRELGGAVINAADETGRRSVSIPWVPLEFPAW